MGNYLEKDLEIEIEEVLSNSGYNKVKPDFYDKELCLLKSEVIDFIKDTQPKQYEKLTKQYGSNTDEKLCYRIAQDIRKKGTLNILRKDIQDRGSKFKMAFYKPKSGMNPEHTELYKKNRFTIVRQLKYSKNNENSIDLVLFLNGLPIVSMELKNILSGQNVENAKKQYKNDRRPNGEPFLQFERVLVHFAVDNDLAFMTTHLQGEKTHFLPFNKGTVNPVNENGNKTAYLWENFLQPDMLLELIESYLHIQVKEDKFYDLETESLKIKTSRVLVFPRYHQLDCVRTILGAVKKDGAGHNYLVQHSAGSGKSNSIAWLAHQLASLYQNENDTERLFDSIIVITDRRVLDRQLQNTIKQFEQTPGVVKPIDKHSSQLKTALQAGKDIIISTIQKFPVISEQMVNLNGNSFAVIIDEAHSSQSGETSKHLKKVLSGNSDEKLKVAESQSTYGDDEFDLEDAINEEIRYRGKQEHISYFAFTATPKNKTIELFGNRNNEGIAEAFHLYTMKQAIEENFILDVLKNYTTFNRYFKLIKTIVDDKEYAKKKAIKLLTRYVDLKEYTIETKVNIMLEHFINNTVHAIEGKGRAMVLTASRLHAVRYYRVFKRLMRERNLTFKPLVAFSGTVKDPDNMQDYTEKNCNKLPPRVDIPDALKTPDYRILVVANKYQTGFDEPLLHTMYVEKKLGGVNAVQALSRLNRKISGKNETFILDFVNDAEEIQNAFQPYFQTTYIEGETDPNKLYDLKFDLEQFEIYTTDEIVEFCKIYFNPKIKNDKYMFIIDNIVPRAIQRVEQEQEHFKSLIQLFIRLYGFVSQIISFVDIELEQLYVFLKVLNTKLPKKKTELPYEVQDAVDLDSLRIQKIYEGSIALEEKDGELKTPDAGTTKKTEEELDLLSNIIKILNESYWQDMTEEEKASFEKVNVKLQEHDELVSVLENENNSVTNKKYKFDSIFDEIVLEFLNDRLDFYNKVSDPKINEFIKKKVFEGMLKQMNKASI